MGGGFTVNIYQNIKDNVKSLSTAEIDAHIESLKAAVKNELESANAEDVEQLNELGDTLQTLIDERESREAKDVEFSKAKENLANLASWTTVTEKVITETATTTTDDDAPVDDTPVEEVTDDAPVEEVTDDASAGEALSTETVDLDEEEKSASAEEKSADDAPAEQTEEAKGENLSVKVGKIRTPRQAAVKPVSQIANLVNTATGKPFSSMEELGSELHKAVRNRRYGTNGEMLKVGSVDKPEALQLTDDPAKNMALLAKSRAEISASTEALVASCCAPTQPITELTSWCDATDGVLQLPRVDAPKGRVDVQLPDAACDLDLAFFEWEQECDPEADPQADKGVIVIDCGLDLAPIVANATGWRFQFTNQAAKFTPEYLAYYFGEAACNFEHYKSARRITDILALPETPAAAAAAPATKSGLVNDLKEILSVKATLIRQSLKARRLRLDAILPAWLQDAASVDSTRRGNTGQTLDQALAELNINPQYVTGWQPIADGVAFPQAAEVLLYAPGVYRDVYSGEEDFGITRDSTLNAKNLVEMMFEEWSSVGYFGPVGGCAVQRLALTDLCPSGAIGPRVDICPTV